MAGTSASRAAVMTASRSRWPATSGAPPWLSASAGWLAGWGRVDRQVAADAHQDAAGGRFDLGPAARSGMAATGRRERASATIACAWAR